MLGEAGEGWKGCHGAGRTAGTEGRRQAQGLKLCAVSQETSGKLEIAPRYFRGVRLSVVISGTASKSLKLTSAVRIIRWHEILEMPRSCEEQDPQPPHPELSPSTQHFAPLLSFLCLKQR